VRELRIEQRVGFHVPAQAEHFVLVRLAEMRTGASPSRTPSGRIAPAAAAEPA
jgi:hypothetical protein